MRSHGLRLALALIAALPGNAVAQTPDNPQAWIQIDRVHRTLLVTAGPFRLAAESMRMAHMSDDMMADQTLPVARFMWPFSTWVRGVQLQLVDRQGRTLPRQLVHHLTIENFDRRDLIYPLPERLMSLGRETQDVGVPRTVGVPMKAGQQLGLWVMWDNTTGRDIDSVFLRLTLRWTAPNQLPRPIDVLPFHVDANLQVGGHNTFDVPPGGVVRAFEFTLPVAGRLVAAGGHLHDHGVSLTIEDRDTGKPIVTVAARRDAQGHVLAVSRKLLALRGAGPRLRAHHPYRLLVRYDNLTTDTIADAMAIIAGLFAPDDLRDWPPIDASDSSYAADLRLYSPTLLPAANAELAPPVVIAQSSHHSLLEPVLVGSLSVLVTGFADQQIRVAMQRGGPETQETGTQISRWSPRIAIGIGVGALGVGLGVHSPALARTGRDALVAMSAAGILTAAAKIVVGRKRPNASRETDAFEPLAISSDDNSFPSGHTAQAFALAAVLASHTRHPLLRATVYGSAAVVGIARIAADRHFASDVVAGAILGTIVGRSVVHHLSAGGAKLGLTPIIAPRQLGVAFNRPF